MVVLWGGVLKELAFLLSVFAVVEFVTESQLRNTSKNLIRSYMAQSGLLTPIERARYAVSRYTMTDIPSLESIKKKSRTESLTPIDHLVLKMEYEADLLDRGPAKRR